MVLSEGGKGAFLEVGALAQNALHGFFRSYRTPEIATTIKDEDLKSEIARMIGELQRIHSSF